MQSPSRIIARRHRAACSLASLKNGDAELADRVLGYWFGPTKDVYAAGKDQMKMWYFGGVAVDDKIRETFGDDIVAAVCGERDGLLELRRSDGERCARGELALVVLLDQFTRNVYRGTADAFSGDTHALAISQRAVGPNSSRVRTQLRPIERKFMYMPLMHSEDAEVSAKCAAVMQEMHEELLEKGDVAAACAEMVGASVRYAREHLDILQRFGRFPHRNYALNRKSTAEEVKFLEKGPRYGQ